MSHWKKFEAKVLENINTATLGKATMDLGLTMDTRVNSITNTWGRESVDAGLLKNGQKIALGYNFKKTATGIKLELSGDFYGTGLTESTFINQLAQAYQKHNTIEKLEEQGWSIDSVETNAKGEIEIEAVQWA